MAVILGKAPGKIILFGEHAVVYNQPAIAIPVTKVKATAHIFPDIELLPGQIRIKASETALDAKLSDLDKAHPLASAVNITLDMLKPDHIPSFTLQISSTIPIAAGLGSGAAVTVAIIRAVSSFLGHPLSNEKVSDLAYEIEKIHHGIPSGIDNNVVTYQKPVYFIRQQPIQFLEIKKPTTWIIADTGEKTPTRETVLDVSKQRLDDPLFFDDIFVRIGDISRQARKALIKGNLDILGHLLNENQALLQSLEVSSQVLENLIQTALDAGAVGAKLSGGGRGGNIIALAEPSQIDRIKKALTKAGAVNVISTKLNKES